MIHSFRAFMGQLIDYAGLFPPASLPLEQAIRFYSDYRKGEDGWMLGRFVIPAGQLQELSGWMPLFTAEQPLRLSIIGSRSLDAGACLEQLGSCLKEIECFRKLHGPAANLDVLELPLPPAGVDTQLLDAVSCKALSHSLRTYCELTAALNDSSWEKITYAVLDAVKACNSSNGSCELGKFSDSNDSSGLPLGLKLRTGGAAPDTFPSPQQVAAVLIGCRDRSLALKCTAGLHHPVRMYRKEVKTKMHGFLNVFVAGLLAHTHSLDAETTAEVIEDERPDSFFITPDRLGWNSLSVLAAEVEALRSRLLISYGSCSFDEPREELLLLKPELRSC
jgi:hypothetical protein